MSGVLLSQLAAAEGSLISSQADLRAQFDLLLASGGGTALWPDPATGRTAAGSALQPAAHEIWFSSTDTTAPSAKAHADALAILTRVMGTPGAGGLTLSRWFENLRERITALYGTQDCTVFLSPSIHAGRNLARAIAYAIHGTRLGELSAGHGESSDFPAPDCLVDVALRGEDGLPREREAIEAEALDLAASLDSPLFLHLLHRSRGGLKGLSWDFAQEVAQFSEIFALVDASAMRAEPEELQSELGKGACVLIAGSTFLSGPEGCAALLVPNDLLSLMRHQPPADLVEDLRAYDLPFYWREPLLGRIAGRVNIGLGLRWSAALSEAERYHAAASGVRMAVLEGFTQKVRTRLTRCEYMLPDAYFDDSDALRGAIVPLVVPDLRGRQAIAIADDLRQALAMPLDDQGDAICHLGTPLDLQGQAALPLSASAAMVSDVTERIARGISFERAMAPVLRDIDTLFLKLERLA
jgi:hypothetical protein